MSPMARVVDTMFRTVFGAAALSQNTLSHLIFLWATGIFSLSLSLNFFLLNFSDFFSLFGFFCMLLWRCGKQFQFKLPALLTFCYALGTLISVNKSPRGV